MRSLLGFLFGVILLMSCGKESFPPIVDNPTYTHRIGQFVWFELGSTNLSESKDFYSELFGWNFDDYEIPNINYTVATYNGRRMAGIVETTNGGMNKWVGAMSVKNAGGSVDNATEMGAVELIRPTRLPGRGSVALLEDPQGATIMLINSFLGDPEYRESLSNELLWMELWADSPDLSLNFYSSLTDLTYDQNTVDGKPYWVLRYEEAQVAGVIENPVDNMRSQWIPYIKVDDPQEMTLKVKSLGGNILMAPRADIRKGSVAVVSDPGGAIFCMQKWPINQ